MISAKSRRWLVCRDESVAAQGQEKQQQERGVLPEPLHTDDSTTAMEAENVTGCKVDRNEWNLTTFLILRLWAWLSGLDLLLNAFPVNSFHLSAYGSLYTLDSCSSLGIVHRITPGSSRT